ncbi:MAG: di-heme oxidoredictase family protein [Planctomycetota bacterium]
MAIKTVAIMACAALVANPVSLFAVCQQTADAQQQSGAEPEHSPVAERLIEDIRTGNRLSGRELFEQDFRTYEGFQSGGDGIGPLFNDVSCIACHHQGGIGGGGDLNHNVDILTFTERSLRLPPQMLASVHPGFLDPSGQFVPSLVLHQFSTNDIYAGEREQFLDPRWTRLENDNRKLQMVMEHSPVRVIEPVDGIYLTHSQRNTPALFGTGLIDQIPEELFAELAETPRRFGVSGRVSRTNDRRPGRFGWRAQLPDLNEFVLSACANEIGLEVRGHSQAKDPHNPTARLMAPEISSADTDAMIEYVASLEAPVIDVPDHKFESATNGLRVFNEIGCAECHVRHVGPARNIFSDLLLHDMGSGLSDPLPASREVETVYTPNEEGTGTVSFFEEPRVVNVYYVGTVTVPQISTEPNYDDPYMDVSERWAETSTDPRDEWKTPPLWGCADSAPYMHDGRSPTLDDAIKRHGGEARSIRLNYMRLSLKDREDLLTFLGCLRAPEAAENLSARR